MGIVPRFEIDENNNKILIMKKKLYQKPNIKVHELPMDALLAAQSDRPQAASWDLKSGAVKEYDPTGNGTTSSGPIINSKRGNLWGDDEE